MAMPPPVTDILDAVADGAEPPSELVEYFREETERLCERAVSRSLRRVVGPSDVFSESVTAMLEVISENREHFADRKQALCYLRRIIVYVAASQARRHLAEKRSLDQTRELPSEMVAADEWPPDMVLAVREVAEDIQSLIEAEEDPLWQLALTLTIREGLTAKQVVESLREAFRLAAHPEIEIPSVRTVQRRTAKKYKAITEKLLAKYA